MSKRIPLTLLLCFLCLAGSVSPAQAKKKKHPGDPGAQSATGSEPVIKPEDLPSVSLQPFVDTHLGQVLAPLDGGAFDKPELVVSMKAAYADGAAAAPAERKPAYQLAQAICDSVTVAMAEREKAVAAMKGAKATQSSEGVQPKGGRKAGHAEVAADNAFFENAQRNEWTQKSELLRKQIVGLYLRERDVERRALATAAAAAAAATPATATPAAVAPAGPVAPGAAGPDDKNQ
jgi:hypothetical protein